MCLLSIKKIMLLDVKLLTLTAHPEHMISCRSVSLMNV